MGKNKTEKWGEKKRKREKKKRGKKIIREEGICVKLKKKTTIAIIAVVYVNFILYRHGI